MTELAPFDPFELSDVPLGDVRDPYPAIAAERLRHGGVKHGALDVPGAMSGAPEGQLVTVFGHDEVAQVLLDHESFASSVYEGFMGPVMGHTILEMDSPEHRGHRALVAHAFRQKMLARWEAGLIRVVVDELIDRFAARGSAELVREFTFAFPAQVIARILGLPRADYPRFQRWSIELISVSFNWDRGIAASAALRDYFAQVVAERRQAPADDIISELTQVEIDGHRLSDEEIFAFLRLLLPAGVETTYRSSGNLLFGLLSDPVQLDAVRRDRSLLPQAIEEGLRWESPLMLIVRKAVRDVTVGGVEIKAGATVAVCTGAAGRDDRYYNEPDRFDIYRTPQPHLTFGFGPHVCLGMHLARLETRIAVDALLDRLPDLRLDPAAEDVHIHGFTFRSPMALPVVFTPS